MRQDRHRCKGKLFFRDIAPAESTADLCRGRFVRTRLRIWLEAKCFS